MVSLKLAKLPDRTPIRVSLAISPDLHQALTDYAAVYRSVYGDDEPVAGLIPAMLEAFLDSDREFARARKAQPKA